MALIYESNQLFMKGIYIFKLMYFHRSDGFGYSQKKKEM